MLRALTFYVPGRQSIEILAAIRRADSASGAKRGDIESSGNFDSVCRVNSPHVFLVEGSFALRSALATTLPFRRFYTGFIVHIVGVINRSRVAICRASLPPVFAEAS